MPVISQNLTIPQGLVDGQVAHASHVIPLYNALNAFNIPSTVGVWQISLVDDTLTTLVLGGVVTKDYAISSVPQLKSIQFYIPFSFNTLAASNLTFTFRVNASGVTTATANVASATSGNGIIWGFIGAHDTTDMPRPFYVSENNDTTPGITMFAPNANLADAPITSIGLTVGGAATGNIKLKHARFWSEG